MSRIYITRATDKRIDILESALKEKELVIELLQNDNQRLSSIIHRDNKLIPAMQLAVQDIISAQENHTPGSEQTSQALSSLADMLGEREQILEEYQSHVQRITPTGYISLDATLLYMLRKAQSEGAELLFSFAENDFSSLLSGTLSEKDLNTILADLLENAIIATRESDVKRILLEVTRVDSTYMLSIYDSGSEFDLAVLRTMGHKRITTHTNSGGSGIGLMSTFELLRRCHAGFILEEFSPGNTYSKKLSIVPDKLSEFKIISYRYNELAKAISRPDLSVLPI